MKKIISFILFLSLVLFLTSCGKQKSMVVLIPNPDGTVGKLEVVNEGGKQVLDEANQAVQITNFKTKPAEPITLTEKDIQSTFEEVLNIHPPLPEKFILYFIQGAKELTKESEVVVRSIIATIKKRCSTDIVVSGHTDTVGTMENNYKLSLERARAINDILVTHGIVPENITVTSHGEGNPLIKTGDNISESQNRRVEVVIK